MSSTNKALFITRHAGAVEWAQSKGIEAEHVSHLDTKKIKAGDTIIGTLPVHMVAEICESHDKVKIGVKGLPKRVIISSVGTYGYGYDKIRDILNALAAYQNKPLVEHAELQELINGNDENYLLKEHIVSTYKGEMVLPARGVWLRRFKNGNAHLFFDENTLLDINRALAKYYGDVLL